MPRHSRQEQILQLKAVKRTWGTEFNKQIELGVKSPISRFYKYYQEQSDRAIEIFKRKGSIDAGDMVTMFTNNDYIKLYESLYESVGLRFAKWYAGNFDKFLQKAANPGANVDTWRTTFKSKGAQVAGERISLVQGSAKRNLMNVTRRLMMDDTFIESGYEDKARMLRSKFKQYNKYQAERLVRTEATFIANYATHESAKTIFPGADMQKEWISVNMGDYPRHLPKHKADHRVMDGVVVDFDKPFQVPTINGMENLMVPGDPNGSGYNVINCRCTSAPFPKPGAQAVTELQDLNFGLAGQMAEQSLYDLAEAVQTATGAAVAEATQIAEKPLDEALESLDDFAESDSTTIKEAKLKLDYMFAQNGINVENISAARYVTLDVLNGYNRQISKLLKKYNVDKDYNIGWEGSTRIQFKSEIHVLGKVSRAYSVRGDRVSLELVNFGSNGGDARDRIRNVVSDRFIKRWSSAVDEDKLHLATVTHEFAHIITNRRLVKIDKVADEFYSKLRHLRSEYDREMKNALSMNNYKQANELWLGEYAEHNIDEFLAEGFAEYNLSSNPSKYAKLIGELVDEYYKK